MRRFRHSLPVGQATRYSPSDLCTAAGSSVRQESRYGCLKAARIGKIADTRGYPQNYLEATRQPLVARAPAQFSSESHGGQLRPHPELAANGLDLGADRLDRDVARLGDLGSRLAGYKRTQHVLLSEV